MRATLWEYVRWTRRSVSVNLEPSFDAWETAEDVQGQQKRKSCGTINLLPSVYCPASTLEPNPGLYKHYFAWASGSAVMSPVSLFYPPLKPNVELHVVIILEIFFSCFNYVLILCSYKTPKVSDHTWMSYWDSSLVKCKEVKSAFLCQTHEDGYFCFTTFCFRMEI